MTRLNIITTKLLLSIINSFVPTCDDGGGGGGIFSKLSLMGDELQVTSLNAYNPRV
jgi:hypothetical protein